ncbi:MAG: phosphatase PAP2 family protein [Coriobacteriia bacterium]|nr:phosphatase PAP2 family protein [Coriobacteriia bacterium]MBN2839686.1 phosphatase PAP2 family protein [Coriobacteriia bacterium]
MLKTGRESWQRDPLPGMLVILAGVLLAGFIALGLALLFAPAFVRADMALSADIRAIAWPWLDPVARAASWFGDFSRMTVLTLAAGLALWLGGRRTSATTLVLTVALGSLIGAVVKLLFGRIRPALEVARIALPESYSFPSGHALSSLLFFGSVAFLILLHVKSLKWAAAGAGLCGIAAFAISLSRVYLGVHYIGDIAGSWLLGFGLLALMVMISARWGASGDPGTT